MSRIFWSILVITLAAARGPDYRLGFDHGLGRDALDLVRARYNISAIGDRLEAQQDCQESSLAQVASNDGPDVQHAFKKGFQIYARQPRVKCFDNAITLLLSDRSDPWFDRNVEPAEFDVVQSHQEQLDQTDLAANAIRPPQELRRLEPEIAGPKSLEILNEMFDVIHAEHFSDPIPSNFCPIANQAHFVERLKHVPLLVLP